MHRFTVLILAGLIVPAPTALARASSFSFLGLGDLPGGDFGSIAMGVSADGLVVVGQGVSDLGYEAFRWTSGGGMVGLGDLPGTVFYSRAENVSADGSVVVGRSYGASGDQEAFRWTSGGGMVGLGGLPEGDVQSIALAASSDGSIVVGLGTLDLGTKDEAFRWTSGGGMVGLGQLPGGQFGSRAFCISRDGSIIVGISDSESGNQLFRWTSGGGMVGLAVLPGQPEDMSLDGNVIVGSNPIGPLGDPTGIEAFRWTSGGGMVGLGDFPGGFFQSQAFGVSADGSLVVGSGSSDFHDSEAFLWTSGGGMVSLRDLLVNHGVSNLTDWTLISAQGVSADGRTIVGYGLNPDGDVEAWIATVPEPSALLLASCGLIGVLVVRFRRRVVTGPMLLTLAVLAMLATSIAPRAYAAVVNGSFETGDLSGWYLDATFYDPEFGVIFTQPDGMWQVTESYAGIAPTDGAFMAVLNPSASKQVFITPNLSASIGDTLSFDYAAVGHSGGGYAYVPVAVASNDTGGQWIHVEFPIAAVDPGSRYFVAGVSGIGSQTLLVDNVVWHPLTSESDPLLPTAIDPGGPGAPPTFEFVNAPSGQWFDPPAAGGFVYTMTGDSLFTQIMDFPSGFGKVHVSVFGGYDLGEFGPGDTMDFTLGGIGPGVSSFTISGIDPNVDPTSPTAFPLKLKFNTDYADFTMQAVLVPEPSTLPLALCGTVVLACGLRAKRTRRARSAN